jgi:hypothetical protein
MPTAESACLSVMIGARGVFALVVAFAGAPAATAFANVVTDWDEIGVKTVQPIACCF